LDEWLKHRRMPPAIVSRVKRYHEAQLGESGGIDEHSLLHALPDCLRQDVSRHQCKKLLQGAKLFSLMPVGFQESVLTHLSPIVIAEGEYICREGDIGDCMYFLSKGEVEVVIGSKTVATLTDGESFGETALLQRSVRTASIVATRICYLYVLSSEDFKMLLSYNANVEKVMSIVSFTRRKYRTCGIIQKTLDRIIAARMESSPVYRSIRTWYDSTTQAQGDAVVMRLTGSRVTMNLQQAYGGEEPAGTRSGKHIKDLAWYALS